ncbi:tetratricopeptide repeat protein [Haliangium sp.]|uniref:tetratricopeptide repeat protein n=1 Tax=Haliangium sp. TaxID=2663208 RepID=UPI003D1325F1
MSPRRPSFVTVSHPRAASPASLTSSCDQADAETDGPLLVDTGSVTRSAPARPRPSLRRAVSRPGAPRGGRACSRTASRLATLPPGMRIGRYDIVGRIGAGGMGVVYHAHDPELEREVAIKLLHPGASGSERDRARLLREAQALAQLSHPNVIKIYDVGTFDSGVFLAMELAGGPTLKQWLRDAEPSHEQILAVFQAAGSGLAAAHRAGLVHRDVKPSNIVIGDDGRVRVLDFGLARAPMSPGCIEDDLDQSSDILSDGWGDDSWRTRSGDTCGGEGGDRPRLLDSQLTAFGDIVGTPAYMSPEQHMGDVVDARGDQFSFCVALYRALYGQRPFEGRTVPALRAAVLTGRLQSPPADTRVPGWVWAALERGLGFRPEDRYPTMDALLADLDRAPRTRRRRRLAIAGAALALTGAAVSALAPAVGERCQGGQERLAEVWNPRVRAGLEATFMATGRSHAGSTYRQVATALDDYGRSWVAMRVAVCEEEHDRGAAGPALDARMACLSRRLSGLRAMIDVLGDGDGEVVDRAWNAVRALPALEGCADAGALERAAPLPQDPDRRAEIAVVDERLDDLDARIEVGRAREARVMAEELVTRADQLGFARTAARAHYGLARALDLAGVDAGRAERHLYQAARLAGQAQDDRLLARIWILAIWVVGATLDRPEDAVSLRPAAEAALARGEDSLTLRAELLGRMAHILSKAGSYRSGERQAEAEEAMTQALTLAESLYGHDHPDLIPYLEWQGNLYFNTGRYREALAPYSRQLAITETHYGRDHVFLTAPLIGLGTSLLEVGPYQAALAHFRRAVAIEEASRGGDTAYIQRPIFDIGVAAYRLGRYQEAVEAIERSLAIVERLYEPEHWLIALQRRYLGVAVRERGDYDRARVEFEALIASYRRTGKAPDSMYARAHSELALVVDALGEPERALDLARRAVTIFTERLGRDHRFASPVHRNLGTLLTRRGRFDEARRALDDALELRLARVGPEHPEIPSYLHELAVLDLAQGRPYAARIRLARALSVRLAHGFEPDPVVAGLRHTLARVHLAMGQREQARDQLEQALAGWDASTADPLLGARTRLLLAELLGPERPERARALAEKARDCLDRLGPRAAPELAAARALLGPR